ncbi:MinD/ParA family protein [Actinomadura macra]|uniref:MinD/ParA family protein n=1 Tax=Actinomadura macra TaxID=46164 RepID=UPI000830D28C|nr:MinD/ParA family protein [Actinomadura macra]
MSDSSWQQAVLREIGVPHQGFQVFETSFAPPRAAWGAEAPPRSVPDQPPAASNAAAAVSQSPAEQPTAPPQTPSFPLSQEGAELPPPPAPPPPAPVASLASPPPAVQEAGEELPPPPQAPSFPAVESGGDEIPPPPPSPALPPPPAAPQLPARPEPEQSVPEQSVPEQSVPEQPVYEQSVQEQPAPEQPVSDQRVYQQPVYEQPVSEQRVYEQPAPEQPVYEQPAPQQSVHEPLSAAPPANEQSPAEPLVHPDFDWAAAVSPMPGVGTAESPGVQNVPDAASARAAQSVQPQAPGPGQGPAAGPHDPQAQIPAEQLVRKNQHGDPLGRRVRQGVFKAVGGGSGNVRGMAAFAELMQHPVPSARQIAVASVRGGAGKTTMAALLATELARHRGDRVLAADADAELGSLPLRLGVRSDLSLFDLAGQNPRSFEEAARFLSRTADGLFVLSSTRGGRIAGEFTLETFQHALNLVTRYLSATVIDCGAGILTELNRGVIAGSHGLVLVTPGTVDGALSARGALEWFAGNDQQALLARTVIAMVSHAPQVGADLERAHQMLSAWGLPVVFIPYDRHLATGGSVDMSRISAAARTAVIRVVHEVFSRSLTAGVSR